MGPNKELQDKIQSMEAKNYRLQKKSQALDGLTILDEEARNLCMIMDKSNSKYLHT